ncbi:hypothetical protein BC829DRAFT_287766 [Chytridium lagenaria]|nr:hypothetical protein BC829DRAFT_287766 [Chytridium lagenaria]
METRVRRWMPALGCFILVSGMGGVGEASRMARGKVGGGMAGRDGSVPIVVAPPWTHFAKRTQTGAVNNLRSVSIMSRHPDQQKAKFQAEGQVRLPKVPLGLLVEPLLFHIFLCKFWRGIYSNVISDNVYGSRNKSNYGAANSYRLKAK